MNESAENILRKGNEGNLLYRNRIPLREATPLKCGGGSALRHHPRTCKLKVYLVGVEQFYSYPAN